MHQVVLEAACGAHACGAVGRWVAGTVAAAVRASRKEGWRSAVVAEDGVRGEVCGLCAKDFVLALSKCPERPACGMPVADVLGHDREGHRITRLLLRKGQVRTVQQFLDLEEQGMLVDFLGPVSLAKVREILDS